MTYPWLWHCVINLDVLLMDGYNCHLQGHRRLLLRVTSYKFNIQVIMYIPST